MDEQEEDVKQEPEQPKQLEEREDREEHKHLNDDYQLALQLQEQINASQSA